MALKLELEVQEINTVLRSLGKHPFDEVFNLIRKIKEQAEPQLAAMQQEAKQTATTEEDTKETKKSKKTVN
jgi:hypothetical protein